jgi:putative Mg2+ transporter-C (MgtC) family protein
MPPWDEFTAALSNDFGDMSTVASATRIALRLLLAAALGGVLGYEREITGKSAGLRTHMLVSLGAALFVLAPLETGATQQDISRVIQGLVAGIGFLGAGAIFRGPRGQQNKGLTTAASIWLTAALGMTVGLGRVATGITATVFALVILHILPGGSSAGLRPHRPNDNPNDPSHPPSATHTPNSPPSEP